MSVRTCLLQKAVVVDSVDSTRGTRVSVLTIPKLDLCRLDLADETHTPMQLEKVSTRALSPVVDVAFFFLGSIAQRRSFFLRET